MKAKSLQSAISTYIKSCSALTIATCVNNKPYCASLFYAYDEMHPALIFKSDKTTRHIIEALKNKEVAGSILPDTLVNGKIRGIQFTGKFIDPEGNILEEAQKFFYGRFPFARAFKGQLWMIDLETVKFTDNTLGFGAKLKWEKA